MLIQCATDVVRILAPAKINLFLEVLGSRSDGFHEVQTVLCPITLFDQLVFEAIDEPGFQFALNLPARDLREVDCAWQIPHDQSNLVLRAVRSVQQQLGIRRGCRIQLTKSIPAAAGLGGGSSDTAAAVVASLVAWNSWNRELATQVCASLGSDIPFFLGDPTAIGLALATGRGEQCEQLAARPAMHFIVTHPPVGCSTKEVYARFEKSSENRHFSKIVAACETGQFQKIGAELFNALQLPAASLTNWIERQLQLFAQCGANNTLMSGSGSSCFALIGDSKEDSVVVEKIRGLADSIQLKRVYSVEAWYGNSIEKQLKTQIGPS